MVVVVVWVGGRGIHAKAAHMLDHLRAAQSKRPSPHRRDGGQGVMILLRLVKADGP